MQRAAVTNSPASSPPALTAMRTLFAAPALLLALLLLASLTGLRGKVV